MLTDEERVLRDGLRALGAAPPAPPAERVASSVRRARRIRARQVAVAGLAVVAIAGPAAIVAGGMERRGAPVASPATWPDRRNPAFHDLAEEALDHWKQGTDVGEGGLGPGETIHWLYADAIPGSDHAAVAFATCAGDECSRLVLTTVRHRPSLGSTWVRVTRQLSPYGSLGPLSAFVDAVGTGGVPGNAVFVLPSPGTARVTYESQARYPGTGGTAELTPTTNGAFVGLVGPVSDTASVVTYDRDGEQLDVGPVGAVGEISSIGHAPYVDAIEQVPGYDVVWQTRGQVRGHPWQPRDHSITAPHAVFARCLNGVDMLVIAGEASKTVPCDGETHLVGEVDEVKSSPVIVSVHGDDDYTTYAVAVGVPS